MKILFFSSYFYPHISGLTIYPLDILKYLVKKHKIKIFTFNDKENKLKIVKKFGLEIFYLPYAFKFSKGFINFNLPKILKKELEDTDLVIINQPSVEALSLTILAKKRKKRIISLLHCFLEDKTNILSKIITKIVNLIINLQLILSDKIVISTNDYIKSFPIYKKIKNKVFFSFPPIKFKKPSLKKLQYFKKIKKNKIWIGFVGRIAQEKGLEYLIKAFAYLKIQNKFVLILSGPDKKSVVGEERYFNKIKFLINQKKINHLFFNNLKNNELSSLYQALDILVLPSINSTEAFGMVQVEAMINGTPVIATNLPGIRLPIKLTKMGILIKPKNHYQLAKAIEEILKNKKKFSNKKLIDKAREIFDIKKVYKFWSNLISSKTNSKIKIHEN